MKKTFIIPAVLSGYADLVLQESARMSAADWYRKTDRRCVFVPFYGIYVAPPILTGVQKFERGTTYNQFLAGTQNGGTCSCDCIGCYAGRDQRVYTETYNYRAIWTAIARQNIEFWHDQSDLVLSRIQPERNRWQMSGDLWPDLCKAEISLMDNHKGTKFWTYTKAKGCDSGIDAMIRCENFNLASRGYEINYGTLSRFREEFRPRGYVLCPATASKGKEFHCGGNCKFCLTHDKLYFIGHTTRAERLYNLTH